MTTKQAKSKFDFSGIDIQTIDPERLSLGTEVQDCALIANTYERGAHVTPTEAAVFATFSRALQNKRQFAAKAVSSLSSYLQSPTESASKLLEQVQKFGGTVSGASAITDSSLQNLNVGEQQQVSFGDSFGNHLLDWARNCIPCDLRLSAFLELHPNLDLLGALEDFIKNAFAFLNDLLGLLGNLDAYSDFCDLLNLLSFMCIPDLQRIIATLMAMFLLEAPTLDGLIGLLQALIAPLFAPILMSITALLDQFSMLVTNPLQCVIDAINAQLKSRGLEVGFYNSVGAANDRATQIGGGLAQLNTQLVDSVARIKNKMDFYVSQVKAMLGEMGAGDSAYLLAKMRMLTLVRMIAFVVAIITALAKGHAACNTAKTPEKSELDNFFQNFLSPQTPFNVWIDHDGKIRVDEKVPVDTSPFATPTTDSPLAPLSQDGNVLQFEGEPLIDPVVIQEIQAKLIEPLRATVPCKLETTSSDTEKLQSWITELNRV